MSWLYEDIAAAKNFGAYKELPQFVKDNLNPNFAIRPYQEEAFRNFITYYETPAMYEGKNIHTLFHMATGSGKTLIMAGLIVYLYSKGYRNFLFFVNLGQIVKKTIDNFMNPASSKYLFGNEIKIDGKIVHINQVTNFQDCNKDDINILFDTTAGLHSDLTLFKENMPTFEDFLSDKTVLIADEAHHLNSVTKSKEDEENEHSWETTINKIKNSNSENIMLEFTATCDLANPEIVKKYQDKIIFDYNLAKFRKDKYSKDIFTLRSDFPQTEDGRLYRSLQALIVSQYKLKRFQELKLNIKPVILFKSLTVDESKKNRVKLFDFIKRISADDINNIRITSSGSDLMKSVFSYFAEKNIDDTMLMQELKLAFTEDVCIDVNNDTEAEKNQLLVNSLEDMNNPYRMIFEVRKLDEGWDCLNLFDIVRLYETRDSKGDKPGTKTISEAQLIGRGARYFPFEYGDKDKYKRKFDSDVDNPLRVCEQLHYHCQNDSRYVNELNNALRAFGIDDADDSKKIHVHNDLKENFLQSDLFKNGFVFLNEIENKQHSSIAEISEIKNEYAYDFTSFGAKDERLLIDDEKQEESKNTQQKYVIKRTIKELISEISYNFVYSEICKYAVFTYESIKKQFPKFKTTKEFISSGDGLGNISISITSNNEILSFKEIHFALGKTISQIALQLSIEKETKNGSKKFTAKQLNQVFEEKGTDRNYTIDESDGNGVPQKNCSDKNIRFDLESEEWYVYSENYGTTEEKRFVKYFHDFCLPDLQKKYSEIKLIRNECQAKIYDFLTGRAFEPDYLLFLKNKESGEYEYTQVFVEPKGKDLLDFDKWKEDFLLQLKESANIVNFEANSKYKIWGLHFYCHGEKDKEFAEDIQKLCDSVS